jgi:predicted NUDIX family NTP pyrophosphohydrolase
MTRSRERSAGILAYRRGNGIEVLLAHPGGPFWAKRDEGAWSIPKGIVESGDLLACAHREFHEETGLSVNGEAFELQPVRQRNGKIVHGFAIEADLDLSGCHSNSFAMEWPPRSGKMKSFPEVDRVEYFDIDTAMKKIHAYQRPFLIELVGKLRSEPG